MAKINTQTDKFWKQNIANQRRHAIGFAIGVICIYYRVQFIH